MPSTSAPNLKKIAPLVFEIFSFPNFANVPEWDLFNNFYINKTSSCLGVKVTESESDEVCFGKERVAKVVE